MSNDRGYTTELVDDSESEFFLFVVFAEIELDSGSLYCHNGIGEFEFNSNTYTGLADMGIIEPITEGKEISSYPIKVGLSAIESALKESDIDFFDAVTSEDFYGRDITLYIGAIGADGLLKATPDILWSGEMQSPSLQVGSNNSVTIVAESELSIFDQSNQSLYSDSQLQDEYNGDLGFEYLEQQVDEVVIWRGSPTNTAGQGGGGAGSTSTGRNKQYLN